MARITFNSEVQPTRYAIAASFDMSGFSPFCRRHDAHVYLNRYLANLFRAFDSAFEVFWRGLGGNTKGFVEVPSPDFAKYTGDGAILLWVRDGGEDFSQDFRTSLVATLRQFQQGLPAKIAQWQTKWLCPPLPGKVRFGIAFGPVYPLVTDEFFSTVDYAGYCINLAVRLQDHCPEIGFIVHDLLAPKLPGMICRKALKMKGSLEEDVYVFEEDFKRASASVPKQVKAMFADASTPAR